VPLVRIDAADPDPVRLAAVGDAVHAALVEAFGIPADDFFQVLGAGQVRFDRGYLGVARDEGFVLVHVTLRSGRTEDRKRVFYAEVARRAQAAGVEPRNVMVVLVENALPDWSFGDGVAQYLDAAP
jgi:Tautomerase enzyme